MTERLGQQNETEERTLLHEKLFSEQEVLDGLRKVLEEELDTSDTIIRGYN